MRHAFWSAVTLILIGGVTHGADLEDALAAIKAVKREGDGNEKAATAWKHRASWPLSGRAWAAA